MLKDILKDMFSSLLHLDKIVCVHVACDTCSLGFLHEVHTICMMITQYGSTVYIGIAMGGPAL